MNMEGMTSETAKEYLTKLFVRAGRLDGIYRTDEENLKFLSESGAQIFKRRSLGLCGHSSVKSLDEVSGILVEIGIASSVSEGRELVPKIAQASKLHQQIRRGGMKYLTFNEVRNERNTGYRITAERWPGYCD